MVHQIDGSLDDELSCSDSLLAGWVDGSLTCLLARLLDGRLEDLWVNDNNIASLDEFMEAIADQRGCLVTLYLERNPCVSE